MSISIISRETPVARKRYACDACAALRRSGIGEDELSNDDLLIVQCARSDHWSILPHQQYVKIVYKDGGEIMTYRGRIDIDSLANRLDLFNEV